MSEPIYRQPELDLEFPSPPSQYTVTISKGAVGSLEVVRTHQARTDEDALNLIEGLRDTFALRDSVTWQFPEVNDQGVVYGLAPQGVVWEILVVPALGTLS